MAVATGRAVIEVARDPYALTLYTSWHLQQQQRVDQFEHEMMQHRLAGLHAYAVNSPKELDALYERFKSEYRRPSSAIVIVDSIARARALIAEHKRMTPVEPR